MPAPSSAQKDKLDKRGKRDELSEAAWRRITEQGVEAATIRGVAEEAGTSAGRVVHYFRSKDELLQEALSYACRRVRHRVVGMLDGLEGIAAIRAYLLSEIPADAERRSEWRVWLAFWGRGIFSEELSAEHGRRSGERHDVLRALVVSAIERGEIPERTDIDADIQRLMALVDGLGLQAMFAPDVMTAEHLTKHVEHTIQELTRPESA